LCIFLQFFNFAIGRIELGQLHWNWRRLGSWRNKVVGFPCEILDSNVPCIYFFQQITFINFLKKILKIINLLNNYPLVSITLASNYETWVPENVKKVYSAKKIRWICTLLSSLPPFLMAAVMGKLGFSFSSFFNF